ncbi:translation protein SH3-like domain-containing protein, partial [Thamnocephalis sphaerospora]
KAFNTRLAPRTKSIKPQDRLAYWKITRGDQVMVLTGKDKEKTGRVVQVFRKLNTVLVSGVNLVYKHVPKSANTPDGRVRKEMPVHVSNLSLINPETGLPTKVDVRKYTDASTGLTENRRYVRGTNIELPRHKYLEYQDEWKDSALDTLPSIASAVTFKPSMGVPPMPEGVINELRGKY